jgi:hypothetical protein
VQKIVPTWKIETESIKSNYDYRHFGRYTICSAATSKCVTVFILSNYKRENRTVLFALRKTKTLTALHFQKKVTDAAIFSSTDLIYTVCCTQQVYQYTVQI